MFGTRWGDVHFSASTSPLHPTAPSSVSNHWPLGVNRIVNMEKNPNVGMLSPLREHEISHCDNHISKTAHKAHTKTAANASTVVSEDVITSP